MEVKAGSIYGLPHINARYLKGWKRTKKSYRRIPAPCICGAPNSEVHHVEPIGMGGHQSGECLEPDTPFISEYDGTGLLETGMGAFILYTPLFGLCHRCHRLFHAHDLGAEWVWYDEVCKELWEKGWHLSHGFEPHDERLYEYGYWRIGVYEVRHP